MALKPSTYVLCLVVIAGGGLQCSSKTPFRNETGEKRLLSSRERLLAVATAEPLATEAAFEIFQEGGNLADALVAASFALTVLRPQSTGIGGGGFLVSFKPGKKPIALDFRETAPSAAHPDMYLKSSLPARTQSFQGVLAAGVPGLVAGLYEFHQEEGRLSWERVLAPSVRLASQGFPVTPALAIALKREKDRIQEDPEMLKVFFRLGTPLRQGDLLQQKDLALSLREIAEHGKDGFYQGRLAQTISAWIKMSGGMITERDLIRYRVRQRKPLRLSWRGYEVITMSPPSSGGIHLLQFLKMTEFLRLSSLKSKIFHSDPSINRAFLEIEVFKRAYADRAVHLGDPDYSEVPLKELLDNQYLKERVQKIREGEILSSAQVLPGEFFPQNIESSETTHLSMMDSQGFSVASTQTINASFGAGVMVPGTGIILNNEMDDFSVEPGKADYFGLVTGEKNEIRPRKRPLSSMTPTLVLQKGRPILALGAPGGSHIITGVYFSLARFLRDRLEPQQAIGDCRYHHQWKPDEVVIEEQCSPQLIAALKAKYQVRLLSRENQRVDVQMVGISGGKDLFAYSDPRMRGIGRVDSRQLSELPSN